MHSPFYSLDNLINCQNEFISYPSKDSALSPSNRTLLVFRLDSTLIKFLTHVFVTVPSPTTPAVVVMANLISQPLTLERRWFFSRPASFLPAA
jgi:hypothetical protein